MRGRGVPSILRGRGGLHGSQWRKREGNSPSSLPVGSIPVIDHSEDVDDVKSSRLKEIQNRIGIVFRDEKILQQAFVHRSFLNENQSLDLEHNERLEFLGDKVFGMALGAFLYRKLPDVPEGKMTQIFGFMSSAEMHTQIAEELGLGEFLLLSRGERREFDSGNRARIFIIANTLEALIGAIYLDRGPGMVELFLQNTIFPRLEKVIAGRLYLDSKSYLQETVQELRGITPTYEVVTEKGPDHNRHFKVVVVCGDRRIGEGTGPSKRLAEAEAARDALLKEFKIEFSNVKTC